MKKRFKEVIKKYSVFWVLSYTWGILMTLLGALVSIPFLFYDAYVKDIMEEYGHCIYFKVGKGWGGFSLGPYCFVCKDASNKTLNHEHGHSIQNCLYGPLMIIFSICSVVRYHYRNFKEKINNPCETKYDDFWFEGQATLWGNDFFNK